MASFNEALVIIHHARRLIQRQTTTGATPPDHGELLRFLADSEGFLADGCGVRPRYLSEEGKGA